MRVEFAKMHGLGNDFVVIDNTARALSLSSEQIRGLADRKFGVGCDQLLMVEPARSSQADFAYRIFNSDGGEVEHCGNGVRCFALFVRDRGLTDKREIVVETTLGTVRTRIDTEDEITVDMGVPSLDPEQVPFLADTRARDYLLDVGGEAISVGVVSIGNPHAVLRVDDADAAPVSTLGPRIQAHPCFPNGVNVGFMQVLDPEHIRLRVFERGVGETLACGTGACAAVAVGRETAGLEDAVTVQLRGGCLRIKWAGEGEPVWMTGPATRVFEGSINL